MNGQIAPLTPDIESVEVVTINQNCLTKQKITTSVPHTKETKDFLPLVSSNNAHVLLDTSSSCTSVSLGPSGPSSIFTLVESRTCNSGKTTPTKSPALDSIECKWKDCDVELKNDEIMDHICTCHIKKNKTVVYLWEGCRVYNKSSCSKSWLERHILTRNGDKTFCFIVEGEVASQLLELLNCMSKVILVSKNNHPVRNTQSTAGKTCPLSC